MRFSIIVPVYQVESYLNQCLESVLRQTFSDFELILVDDGSTDGSAAICKEYAQKDDRVRLIQQPNGGLSAARNTGISEAKGDYLIFLDSDDYWLTRFGLEEINNCLQEGPVDAVFWKYRKVAEEDRSYSDDGADGFSSQSCKVPEQAVLFIRSHQLVACAWDVAISRALFEDDGLVFETGVYSEDVEWLARLLKQAKRFVFTDMVLNAYRMRSSSITKNISETNLADLHGHYRRISQYIADANQETARMLQAYLGEQTANYILTLALAPAQYQKEYGNCEYLTYVRYGVTGRAKLIGWMKRLFGVSGTVFLIKKIKRIA